MVLRREANVHKVPIASDIHTAKAFIAAWQGKLAQPGTPDLFRKRTPKATSPLDGLTDHDRVLAMIAHDAKKLELCCFAVEHMTKIFKDFDYILATGTTGEWLKNFANACGRGKHDVDKIRLCESGPKGGDVQIAAAVARGICRRVIFLQDPFTSHAHETDIHLFEQSVLLFERAALTAFDIELATNVESARAILGV
jgi:methylglyoxal synthase